MSGMPTSCVEAVGGEAVVRQLAEEHNVIVDQGQLEFLEKFGSLVLASTSKAPVSHAATARETIADLQALRTGVHQELLEAVEKLDPEPRASITAWEVEESTGGLPLVNFQVNGAPLLVVRISGLYAERQGAGVSYGLKVGDRGSLDGFVAQAKDRLDACVKKKGRVVPIGDLVSQWVTAVAQCQPVAPGADGTETMAT